MKKLFLVKREVMARDVVEAATARGKIYEISLASDKEQPENLKPIKGFVSKKV